MATTWQSVLQRFRYSVSRYTSWPAAPECNDLTGERPDVERLQRDARDWLTGHVSDGTLQELEPHEFPSAIREHADHIRSLEENRYLRLLDEIDGLLQRPEYQGSQGIDVIKAYSARQRDRCASTCRDVVYYAWITSLMSASQTLPRLSHLANRVRGLYIND